MNYLGIQIVTIAFSIFMIYFSYFCWRRGYFETPALLGWIIIFVGLVVGSVFPKILQPFIEFLSLARLFDLYVIIGLIFLTVITFINFLHVHKLQNKLDHMIQDQAIENGSGKRKKTQGEEVKSTEDSPS